MTGVGDHDGETTTQENMRAKRLGSTIHAELEHGSRTIYFFGYFGLGNFGNESTLQAMLCSLRPLVPDAEFKCICSGPTTVAKTYNIDAIPIRDIVVKPWKLHNSLSRWLRKLIVGIPSEVFRWIKGLQTLWGADMLIIPGTGVLTDAYTLLDWGPYDMFRWSITAKLCRCQLLFVSVGAGPLYSYIGRLLVKVALSLADFRSYRDQSTVQYLQSIGFRAENDSVYPDLAFSLPETIVSRIDDSLGRRSVVGVGLMEYAGKYSVEKPTQAVYVAYLDVLVELIRWLLAHGYNVRLLIGDLVDTAVTAELKSLLKERSVTHEEGQIVDEPVGSVEDLLSQLSATDFVIATRFHNILLALLLNKPVLAVSFHHKCVSLMREMGLLEYCQDINHLDAERLIAQFRDLETHAETLRPLIKKRTQEFRRALDEQYDRIVNQILSADHVMTPG